MELLHEFQVFLEVEDRLQRSVDEMEPAIKDILEVFRKHEGYPDPILYDLEKHLRLRGSRYELIINVSDFILLVWLLM